MVEYHFGRSAATRRLSRTVRSSKSSSDWNVLDRPRWARALGETSLISAPSKSIVPPEGFVKPVMASMKVVLPAPFGPDEPGELAGLDGDVDVVVGVQAPVGDRETLRLEQRHRATSGAGDVLGGSGLGGRWQAELGGMLVALVAGQRRGVPCR